MNAPQGHNPLPQMRLPDMTGPFGRRAWRSRVSHEGSGRLSVWIMDVPFAHPSWHYWLASLTTVKDIPGLAPAHKHYPEAEYEVLVGALYPEPTHRRSDGEYIVDIDAGKWNIMTPTDFVYQFHGVTEQSAQAMLYDYVRTVVERGIASPDSDYRRWWSDWFHSLLKDFQAGPRMMS